jgi:spore coat polysaccharide biosynthesis protein SpsF
MTTVVIVQARMGSTRLPGKVLKDIDGRPMLSYLLERLRRARLAQKLVVATTTEQRDEAIVRLCSAEGVASTRGSEDDVLRRFEEAAQLFDGSVVVRVTADCPLLEPELVDEAITCFRDESCDYLSNMLEPSWPYGMAVEVFSRRALREADREATDPAEREHVTPFIYRQPQRYRLRSITMQPDLSGRRWTVDTAEDFELVSRILSALYPRKQDFRLGDVLALLRDNPGWEEINRHVEQRHLARKARNAHDLQE